MKRRIRDLIPLAMLLLSACKAGTDPASIGIIGGADGPTAVFVTSQMPKPLLYTIIGVIAAAVVGVVVWLCRRK